MILSSCSKEEGIGKLWGGDQYSTIASISHSYFTEMHTYSCTFIQPASGDSILKSADQNLLKPLEGLATFLISFSW